MLSISMIMIMIMIMITIMIMIMIKNDSSNSMNSLIEMTTAVLLCPPSVPVQPTREKEGEGESEGGEQLIKWRVRCCSTTREREREGERAAAGQRGRSVRAWRR
jgi:hypothetical protein